MSPPRPSRASTPATVADVLHAQQETNQLLRAVLTTLASQSGTIVIPSAIPPSPSPHARKIPIRQLPYTDQDVMQVDRAQIFQQEQETARRMTHPYLDPRAEELIMLPSAGNPAGNLAAGAAVVQPTPPTPPPADDAVPPDTSTAARPGR